MYYSDHQTLTEPINLTIVPNEQIYHHNTRSKYSVHRESSRTKLSANGFIHAGPEHYNKLPETVKSVSPIFSFSIRLKQHIIERYAEA